MRELSKAVKKKVRALNGLAWERELSAALTDLERDFSQWREGKLDAFKLSDRIHEFHDGRGRELYKQYAMGQARLNVGYAIHRKVLTEAEAGPEVLEQLASVLEFYRGLDARS